MAKNVLKSPLMKNAYDRFLRTLCNKTRLAIIQSLRGKPKNVSQLTKELGMHQTSTSHALKRLLECGFVSVYKKGKERFYTLNKDTIRPLMKLMEKHTIKFCSKCVGGKKK